MSIPYQFNTEEVHRRGECADIHEGTYGACTTHCTLIFINRNTNLFLGKRRGFFVSYFRCIMLFLDVRKRYARLAMADSLTNLTSINCLQYSLLGGQHHTFPSFLPTGVPSNTRVRAVSLLQEGRV